MQQHTVFSRPACVALCFALLGPVVAAQGNPPAGQAAAPPPLFRIRYTGKLLGYFRLPNEQTMGQNVCPVPDSAGTLPSPAAQGLLEELGPQPTDPPTILVGMGDNFAPQLLARTFAPSGTQPLRLSKDRYTWGWLKGPGWIENGKVDEDFSQVIRQGQGYVPVDNVGCFFARAGYLAIVPGKQDFYFGPERLRYLARFLASFPADGAYKPVQMLAANLVIRTTFFKDHERLNHIHGTLQYETAHDTLKPLNFSDHGFVLPWLRRFKVGGADPGVQADICPAERDHPARIDLGKCTPLKRTPRAYEWALPEGYDLQVDENYAVCMRSGQDTKRYCVRFSVYAPFFQYPSTVPTDSAGKPLYQTPAPYALDPSGQMAVFGVVDPDLRESVGQLNFAWKNRNTDYKTEIEVMDAATALDQLLQFFDDDYQKKYGKPFAGTKVLLAQMSAPRARELAASLQGVFRVVLAEAQAEHATPNLTLQVDPLPEERAAALAKSSAAPREGFSPTFVAVPQPYWDPILAQPVPALRTLTVSKNSEKWTFEVKASTVPPREMQPNQTHVEQLTNLVREALKQNAIPVQSDLKAAVTELRKALAELALEVMREKAQADVSLIQKRDFYDWYEITQPVTRDNLQETLDAYLWKGDFLLSQSVPGGTLLKVLDRSKRYDREDDSPISVAVGVGRGLQTLGVFYDDKSKEYLINGVPLDPGRLYKVATTDYVGLGDTGYSELAIPAVGDALRPVDFENELKNISYLVCQAMEKVSALKGASCLEPVKPEDYFDALDLRPADPRAGDTPRHQLQQWSNVFHPTSYQPPSKKMPAGEQTVQDRPTLQLSLEKANFNFLAVDHGLSEAKREETFSGVPIAQLNSSRSHTFDWDLKFKGTRFWKNWDTFLSGELRYLVEVTGQKEAPAKVNQKKNLWAVEYGMVWHRGKNLPRWGFLIIPARFERPLFKPVISFGLGRLTPTSPDRGRLTFKQGRSLTYLAQLGPRYQGRRSWIEGGYQFGREFHALRAYLFTDPANPANTVTCAPSASQSLEQCARSIPFVTKDTPPTVDRDGKFRHGFFLNFKTVVPFHPKLAYVVENEADFFFTNAKNDNSTETRLQNIWKQAVSIPVFSNLSVEPKFEVFLFRNKLENHRFWQTQSSLSLNYTFDWFSGGKTRHALEYKKPKP